MSEKSASNASYYATSDRPTSDDKLGFQSYINAVKQFLTDPKTDSPLTLSIEGNWGTGKSSFLLQLKSSLEQDGKYTVQFNPWRHEDEEELWAAFAIQFFRQITQQVGFRQRWKGNLRLYFRRIKWKKGRLVLLRSFLIIIASAILSIVLPLIIALVASNLIRSSTSSQPGLFLGSLDVLIGAGGIAVSLAGLITLLLRVRDEIKNAVITEMSEYAKNPDYEDKIPFIEKFHRDFPRIIQSYVGKEPVYIFIDDLDRCKATKSGDLMKAINMMVSEDPNVFFIIAMDRRQIAASVASKHEEVIPYLNSQKENGTNNKESYSSKLKFGYKYTNKFIEVPFQVPSPTNENINAFVSDLVGNDSKGRSENQWYHTSREIDGFDDTVQEVTTVIADSLNYNPRKIKKFVNVYRLQALLAKERGILDMKRGVGIGITIEQLGKFVALTLQYPSVVKDLSSNPSTIELLQSYSLGDINKEQLPSEFQRLTEDDDLMSLFGAGCDEGNIHDPYSFEDANIKFLLQITPESPSQFSEKRRVTVRIKEDIGEIYGVDGREYELRKSDIVTLPVANAVPMLERDAAIIPDSTNPSDDIQYPINEEVINSKADTIQTGSDGFREMTIRMTEDLGKLNGVDGIEYYLHHQDVVSLPAPNAIPLLERGMAEVV